MKKTTGLLLAIMMALGLCACGKKPSNAAEEFLTSADSQSQTGHDDSAAPAGAISDPKELGEAISYRVDSEGHVVISVKTSASIKKDSGWLGICPMGVYLTEEAADAADVYYEYLDPEYDQERADGMYTFVLNNENITPDTYTMVLCDDDDSGNVIGEWIFNKTKSGTIEIGFDGSWLKGAGEGGPVPQSKD